MEKNLKLEKEENVDYVIIYRNLIISIGTRPDICFAVNYLRRFQNSYNKTYYEHALRILCYLYETRYLNLVFNCTPADFDSVPSNFIRVSILMYKQMVIER